METDRINATDNETATERDSEETTAVKDDDCPALDWAASATVEAMEWAAGAPCSLISVGPGPADKWGRALGLHPRRRSDDDHDHHGSLAAAVGGSWTKQVDC